MPVNGLIPVAPTSVSYVNGTATINSDKTITVTATNPGDTLTGSSILLVDGVFTSEYKNYMIQFHSDPSPQTTGSPSTTASIGWLYLRAAGVNSTNTSLYGTQTVYNYNPGSGFGTYTETVPYLFYPGGPNGGYSDVYIFSPNLTQPTTMRITTANQYSITAPPAWFNCATVHTASSAYDGFYYNALDFPFSGKVAIFGFNQ